LKFENVLKLIPHGFKLGRFELKLALKEPLKIQNKIKTGLKVLFKRKNCMTLVSTSVGRIEDFFGYFPISVIRLFVIHWLQLILFKKNSLVISCKDIKKRNQFNFGFQYDKIYANINIHKIS